MRCISWVALLMAIGLTISVMAGCSSLGIQPVDTINKKIAAARMTTETVADTVAALDRQGNISKEDGRAILAKNREAMDALNVAESTAGVNLTDANQRLTSALTILASLQAELARRDRK